MKRMTPTIDINCDMGESFGVYCIGSDEEVIPYVTSSNVACGFHASDPDCMARTVKLCAEHGVMVGAHPGYPDILGFGRRFMEVGPEELRNYVLYQTGALKAFLDFSGLPLQHIKLHGALYNYMAKEPEAFLDLARQIEKAFKNVIFLTLASPMAVEMKKAGAEKGLRIALEAFPDRAYTDGGELLGRKHKGAVLKDPETIARRAVVMAREKHVESVNGQLIPIQADTLCIHGDNTESIQAARRIQELLRQEEIDLKPLSRFI